MNSPKCRISDIKVILARCAMIEDPILLRETLLECVSLLDNYDMKIENVVEQLIDIFKNKKLTIQVNTNVMISKELFEYIKQKIFEIDDDITLIFNSDDCIINSVSVIDSFNLINFVSGNNKKLLILADDSVFSLKMLFQSIKNILFPDIKSLMPDISGNYATFETDDYLIVLCKNGKIAQDVFKIKVPYVIITDNDMPFMTGFELSKFILKSNNHSRIIMLSGTTDQNINSLIDTYSDRMVFVNKMDMKKSFERLFREMFVEN